MIHYHARHDQHKERYDSMNSIAEDGQGSRQDEGQSLKAKGHTFLVWTRAIAEGRQ